MRYVDMNVQLLLHITVAQVQLRLSMISVCNRRDIMVVEASSDGMLIECNALHARVGACLC